MSKQQYLYETAVPVNSERHANSSVEVGADFSFAREVNSLPLMAVEFAQAASDYAIVFAGNEEAVMPAVILGVRDNENLYVENDGKWKVDYIPAFVRRYPFIFSASEDGKTFTLCIDEKYQGFNSEGKGQRLFDDEKKASPYVDNVLKFLQEYRNQFSLTQQFCTLLKELDLLEPMQAEFTLRSGKKMSLAGFMAINREKLKQVPAEKLEQLVKNDGMELIYLHLYSMRNFSAIKDSLVVVDGGKPEETEEEAPAKKLNGKG